MCVDCAYDNKSFESLKYIQITKKNRRDGNISCEVTKTVLTLAENVSMMNPITNSETMTKKIHFSGSKMLIGLLNPEIIRQSQSTKAKRIT